MSQSRRTPSTRTPAVASIDSTRRAESQASQCNASEQEDLGASGASVTELLDAVEAEHSFNAGGESHTLWFEGTEPMVASTPSRLEDFVNRLSEGQRETIVGAPGYNDQLNVILTQAGLLRNLATETRKAVSTASDDAFDAKVASLTHDQQAVMRALKFVFDVLPNADKRDVIIDLVRARQDDLVVRLETALAAAGNAQDQQATIEWIEGLGLQLNDVRLKLTANVDKDAVTSAAAALDPIEEQVGFIEDVLQAALAGQATIDAALQDEESPAWRDRLQTILGILNRSRSRVTAAIPFGRVRFRGSLATGWKGPHKVEANGSARRFNPEEFDADAFVELPNELWLQMVEEDLVDGDDLYAKSADLVGWEHQALLAQLETDIGAELAKVAGYQREHTGEIHFDFTVQPMSSTWKNLRDGLAYPQNAFGMAGANDLQATLPDNANTSANQRTRFPGTFRGE